IGNCYVNGCGTFDVVVVNLYPFYDTVTSTGVKFEDGIENIDIGGPAMIRVVVKLSWEKPSATPDKKSVQPTSGPFGSVLGSLTSLH
ncbi:hypothetical protein PIB30_078710, partial [Stylosanthes scabra]|nr:hypothetical protein [Stylosanthes scabra]